MISSYIPLKVYNLVLEALSSDYALRCKMFNITLDYKFSEEIVKSTGVLGFDLDFNTQNFDSLVLYVNTDFFLIPFDEIYKLNFLDFKVLEKGKKNLTDTCYICAKEFINDLVSSFIDFNIINTKVDLYNYNLVVGYLKSYDKRKYHNMIFFKFINIKTLTVYYEDLNNYLKDFFNSKRVHYDLFKIDIFDDINFISNLLELKYYELCDKFIIEVSLEMEYIHDLIYILDKLMFKLPNNLLLSLELSHDESCDYDIEYCKSLFNTYNIKYKELEKNMFIYKVELF